ncbi:hypothetical protein O181_081741 [Austropuccinia psidii MF-1]|uniref:Uncharacterized protein n=1 Tax=Austropuccinia psidii MF-1 TaxID=1389203 RepID=A0A9Q3FKS9_9BASI|nr:hypothetical protein [Austropuccinia psidii MF-1]
MPHKQTPQQPTPGPSGPQWSEDLFYCKQPTFPFLILTFSSSELTLPPFVEPPIPGPSQASEPHEDPLTCEPEPEVVPTQSTEEPFVYPATPASVTIIDDMPIGCPCSFPRDPFHFHPEHNRLLPPAPSSPQSYNDAWQEFMDLQLTLMIPQAIVHKSINQILLEHHCLLQMIHFVDVTYKNEMYREWKDRVRVRVKMKKS